MEETAAPNYNDVDNLAHLLIAYRGGLQLRQQVFMDALDEGKVSPDEVYVQLGGDEAFDKAAWAICRVLQRQELRLQDDPSDPNSEKPAACAI